MLVPSKRKDVRLKHKLITKIFSSISYTIDLQTLGIIMSLMYPLRKCFIEFANFI